MSKQHASRKECEVTIKEQLRDMLLSHDKWMAVAWGIGPDGKLTMCRTTCNFPLADVEGAISLLRQNMAREAAGLDTSPLPVALGFNTVGDALGESK